ncbi:DnaJ domain-containing protein [Paraburkholderia sediminicola]|uniref:DnaJ domain-containing protein n=1 Tax=Paraburkholderia sediminicola TaxID=458836 RepID=UPI0038B86BA8
MHTHYDNLKVTRGAPADVIKAAYRTLSQRYHPDRNPSPDATRVMRILNDAYAVLSDPERRAVYDRELEQQERDEALFRTGSDEAKQASNSGSDPTSPVDDESPLSAAPAQPSAPEFGTSLARFFGRIFDTWWESMVIGLAISYYLSSNSAAFVEWITGPGSGSLFAILCLPIAMILDAGVYSAVGNTPGKALLGLKVTTLDGSRLSYAEYSRRNLAVWARGLGCGVPLVNIFTMWNQKREVNSNRQATYDVDTGYRVRAGKTGFVRKTVFGILFLALFIGVSAMRATTDRQAPNTLASTSTTKSDVLAPNVPPTSWTNPLTGNTATVDGIWKPSSKTTADNQTVYTFAEDNDRSALFFAVEDGPNLSMGEYVLAYLRTTSSSMSLSAPESVDHSNGTETWVADGHLTSKQDLAVHVELRHIGQSFWRMVIIESHPYGEDDALKRLKQQLWGTVSSV